ncbi:MAG: hypothetical protein N2171_05885, partial [Clostridia bacterium]|nr:hypothetical protein [Clostridia bacterium]
AFIVANLLSSVVNGSSGTGTAAKLSKMPTFGKTGTTNDDMDRWFVGFTPYYVGAVWYGFDQPKSIKSAGVSYNPSTRTWKTVMEQVHKNLAVKELDVPSDIISESICTITGLKAAANCPSETEYFVKGTQPKTVCNGSHGGNHSVDVANPEEAELGIPSSNSDVPSQTATPKPAATAHAPTPTPAAAPTEEPIPIPKPSASPRSTPMPSVISLD